MVLRLHVLGPAFGLASIDAECLAAITYLAYAVPQTAYELVATSPSGVPTHALPALRDTATGVWTTGFVSIADYLSTANPAWALDAPLAPAQRADSTACAAFLAAAAAAPLLALNLYVSSANYAAATRPAYSAVLPFPLTWTEPPAIRRRMCHVAAHLGLSDLNIDEELEDRRTRAAEDDRGFLKVPARLRTLRGVRAALSPEHTALFRLEAAGVECLGVVADLKGQHEGEGRFFFGGERPTALDCLAFGYLALMLVPEVPRPWLRDMMRRRYDCLCVFVDGVRDELFGGDVASLPWVKDAAVEGQPWKMTRFARGVIEATVPDDWLMAESSAKDEGKPWAGKKQSNASVLLSTLLRSVAGFGLVGSVLLYRHLSPFGSAFYRWELQRRNFGAGGGALFGI